MIRVLVATHCSFIRRQLARCLKCRGAEVYEAQDESDAAAMHQLARPHVAILEHSSTGMDGIGTALRIQLHDPYISVLLIVDPQDQAATASLEYVSLPRTVIYRPIVMDELYAVLAGLLSPNGFFR